LDLYFPFPEFDCWSEAQKESSPFPKTIESQVTNLQKKTNTMLTLEREKVEAG
jgi:hypothetical protein